MITRVLSSPPAGQISDANDLLADCGVGPDEPIGALSPGASGRRNVKEWTDQGFAAVGSHLARRGLRVLVVGTQPADNIVKEHAGILDLSGRTNLGQLVAILARCRVLVAVDSGVLHLCAAAGGRVVGLYGPSNAAVTGPQGSGHLVVRSELDCSPCVRTECKRGRECMVELSPKRVIEAVDRVLRESGASPHYS